MQDETAVILILSGTDRLSDITSYDPQVNRRFAKIVPKDLAIGADEARLSKLVRDYARRAGSRAWRGSRARGSKRSRRVRICASATASIPTCIDRNSSAQARLPMERMRQGWAMISFQASQQWATMSS